MRYAIIALIMLLCASAQANDPTCYSVVAPNGIDGRIVSHILDCGVSVEDGGTLYIRSYGGSSSGGRDLALMILGRNITVRVVDYCHSACVRLLLTAANVEICDGATVGVHRANDNGWRESKEGTLRQVAFYQDHLGQEDYRIIELLLSTPWNEISYVPEIEWPKNWEPINCQ